MATRKVVVPAVLLCLAVLSGPFAHAQAPDPVMGICTGWPWLSTSCALATPALQIGTTTNPIPTFQMGINDGGTAPNVMLIALVPNTSVNSLSFSASFNGMSTASMTKNWTTGTLLQGLLGLSMTTGFNNGGPNDYTINGGGGAALSGVQSVPGVTSYAVYAFTTGQTVLGPNATGGPTTITVSFSTFSNGSGFPAGTIFLAIGLSSDGKTVFFTTPLTLALEVPEPSTAVLLISGLLAVAPLLRRMKHNYKVRPRFSPF